MAFITTTAVTLSTNERCVETGVRMFVKGSWYSETAAKAADNDYWSLTDILDYKTGQKRAFPFGRLVDDAAVIGQLLTDTADPLTVENPTIDEKRCRTNAAALAVHIGGTPVRQSVSTALIAHPLLRQHMTVSCLFERPSVSVPWLGGASPSVAVQHLMARSGALIASADEREIRALINACIADMLLPGNSGFGRAEVDGVAGECQAFILDDAGGLMTMWRRFGSTRNLIPD